MNSLNPEDGISISQWGLYMIARVKWAQERHRWSDQRRRIHLAKLSKEKRGQGGRIGENQTRLLLTTKEHMKVSTEVCHIVKTVHATIYDRLYHVLRMES